LFQMIHFIFCKNNFIVVWFFSNVYDDIYKLQDDRELEEWLDEKLK